MTETSTTLGGNTNRKKLQNELTSDYFSHNSNKEIKYCAHGQKNKIKEIHTSITY